MNARRVLLVVAFGIAAIISMMVLPAVLLFWLGG